MDLDYPKELQHIPGLSLRIVNGTKYVTALNIGDVFKKHPLIVRWLHDDDLLKCIEIKPLVVLTLCKSLSVELVHYMVEELEISGVLRYLFKPSVEIQLAVVKRYPFEIQHIENPCVKVQLKAVKNSGYAIRHIKNPSYLVQLAAVQQNGYAISNIHCPTGISMAVQIAAVKNYSLALTKIKNPPFDVQLAAVKSDPDVIEYIKNPSAAIQLAAIERNIDAVRYIKKPDGS